MKTDHGQSESIWMTTARMPEAEPLARNLTVDVCVVGAGISGITTAYLLSLEEKTVALIDDGKIAGGVTAVTTGHLANALDDHFHILEKLHGENHARLAAESHGAAIDWIESKARELKIDCGFERVNGYLFADRGQSADAIEKERPAAERAGLKVRELDSLPWSFYKTGPCLEFADQAQFHVWQFLAGLLEAYKKNGGKVYSQTHAEKITGGKNPEVITAEGYSIHCEDIVLATNAPLDDVILSAKQAPYRTFAAGAPVPAGSIPHALYWDTLDPYHYVRLHPLNKTQDLLIVGGEDHKTGQADDAEERYARLEAWTRERFTAVKDFTHRWSGQVLETVDGLAFIGLKPGEENVYVITGDSGNGLTHGTLGAGIITDLILGRKNPWADVYDPLRFTLKSTGELVKENLNAVKNFVEWVTPGNQKIEEPMAPESGAIIRKGIAKIAVYCDKNGKHHKFSAVCPHLKCIVHWNSAEKSWDCPCHGSRFDTEGQVINGPATNGLKPLED